MTSAGAEVLPFLGSYGVLPGSILFYLFHERIVSGPACGWQSSSSWEMSNRLHTA